MSDVPATERQVSYLKALVEGKDLTGYDLVKSSWLQNPDNLHRLTKQQASTAIQELRDLPWKPKLEAPVQSAATAVTEAEAVPTAKVEESIPKGYFFIVDPTDNKEKFFRVDKPEQGKWKGYTFLHVQASDDFYPIKDRNHRQQVLEAIAVDPLKAMNEYGLRLGRCGRCNRTLTDRDSRMRGLGPICAGILMGQPTEEEIDILSQLGLIGNGGDE